MLNGSDRILIPYGKHPLASRMRWKGITARPREEGRYKGILPVMEAILVQKRNRNILRFARTMPCRACAGRRLRPEALAVVFRGRNIAEMSRLSVKELADLFRAPRIRRPGNGPPASLIRDAVLKRTALLQRLGLGYLTLDRAIRDPFRRRGPAYPAGLAGRERPPRRPLRPRRADGRPSPGGNGAAPRGPEGPEGQRQHRPRRGARRSRHRGGRSRHRPRTRRRDRWRAGALRRLPGRDGRDASGCQPDPGLPHPGHEGPGPLKAGRRGSGTIDIIGARKHNLKNIDVSFGLGVFNVVTGLSGAGKSTLVRHILAARLREGPLRPRDRRRGPQDRRPRRQGRRDRPVPHRPDAPLQSRDLYRDLRPRSGTSSPPGRSPRPGGGTKGRFSFNVKGGRCETCQGAGLLSIGMHFLGDVEVVCPECEGRRFNDETLEVRLRGKDIHEVLDMSFAEAADFFRDQPAIRRFLDAGVRLGLGYLKLGQSSTTLSGGEAQRIRLASELGRPQTGTTFYILDEPTMGLHPHDVGHLLASLRGLVDKGQHHRRRRARSRVHPRGRPRYRPRPRERGRRRPGRRRRDARRRGRGTRVPDGQGPAAGTGSLFPPGVRPSPRPSPEAPPIRLTGVITHNLKGVDAVFPFDRLTVISGPSGSGKSSLAFDTLYAESLQRYIESFSPYVRSLIDKGGRPDVASAWGLTPPIAIGPSPAARNPRSTVGTMTEIYDYYRLLFSRAGTAPPISPEGRSRRAPSPSTTSKGACPRCKGLGLLTVGDPDKLVTDPDKPLDGGALDGTKTGRFYGEPHGQYVAALMAAGQALGIDFRAVQGPGRGGATRRHVRDGRTDLRGRLGVQAREPLRGIPVQRAVEGIRQPRHRGVRAQARRPPRRSDAPPHEGGRLPGLLGRPPEAGFAFREMGGPEHRRAIRADRPRGPRILRRNGWMPGFGGPGRGSMKPSGGRSSGGLPSLETSGSEYLALDRRSATLSGGEAGRLRLAAQLGARLSGVTYVLDEPTIGLHPRDTDRLVAVLKDMTGRRNTVVVVEHDIDVIRAADRLIDMGPGAGAEGGRIVAEGSPDEVAAMPCVADRPLSCGGRARRPSPFAGTPRPGIRILGAAANNLRVDRRRHPGRRPDGRDRRLRERQVEPRFRCPDRVGPGRAGPSDAGILARHRAVRPGHSRRSGAARRRAAEHPRDLRGPVRRDPGTLRRDGGGQGARIPQGPFFVPDQGRPLRNLRRRREDDGRHGLPGRRRDGLRGLRRSTV